jgi:hypothetical protein
MAVNSRAALIEYCLRRLGSPVIEINVDEDQVEDRIDEGLQMYQEFHSDATTKMYLKHLVTATDIVNGYIPISQDIIFVAKLFSSQSSIVSGSGMFSVQYQMALNDMHNLATFMGDLSYYHQMRQYMSTLDMELNGTPQVNFSRHQDRLYIYGDFVDGDIVEGQYLVAEVVQINDPETYTSVYDDMWLKKYCTALIKRQWGQNLSKFEGMQLPGGVTMNGPVIYQDALAEIEKLEEDLRLTYETPPDFMVG